MGDEIYNYWKNTDSRVTIFHLFDDPYQPYSCTQWGNAGDGINVPPIINDGYEYFIGEWFNDFDGNSRPYTVFIDHNLVVRYFIDGKCNTDLYGENVSPEVCVEKRIAKLLETLDADPVDVEGCIDESACNYNSVATMDDGSCKYIVDVCEICGGSEADENNCLGIYNDFTVAKQFQIQQLYPNPFNPVLNININLAWAGMTQVNILDIAGVHIKTLHSGFLKSGSHELSWHAESMPSGLYFISLKLGDKNLTKKVVLLK